MGEFLIFVDAYPYEHRKILFEKLEPYGMEVKAIKPTFGFSINQKALLFNGETPDKCGYFNEWYVSATPEVKVCWKILDYVLSKTPPKFEGLLHRLYTRLVGENYYRIPFALKGYFERNPTEVYNRDFPNATFLNNTDWIKFLYRDVESKSRDEENVHRFIQYLNGGSKRTDRVFIAFADLDSGLHQVSGQGKDAEALCLRYAIWIENMVRVYSNKYPDNRITILSDHGMSVVKKTVKLDLSSQVGLPGRQSYLYFLDATMCRVWYYDNKYRELVRRYLLSVEGVYLLNHSDREKYSITNKSFGHDIFTLNNDSLMFAPSFYGRQGVKGMHGYLPDFNSQLGICMTNSEIERDLIESKEFFSFLKENG